MQYQIISLIHHFHEIKPFLNYSAMIAKQAKALLMLQAVQPIVVTPSPIPVGAAPSAPSQLELSRWMEESENALITCRNLLLDQNIQVDYALDKGSADVVLQEAVGPNTLMVLVEKQNNASFFNALLGTYETRIAKALSRPVMIVPKDQSLLPIQTLSFIVDPTTDDFSVLENGVAVANAIGAHLDLLMLYYPTINYQEQHARFLEHVQHLIPSSKANYLQINANDLEEKIEELSLKGPSDCIAFGQRSKTIFQRLMGESGTNKLILEIDIPVLVI